MRKRLIALLALLLVLCLLPLAAQAYTDLRVNKKTSTTMLAGVMSSLNEGYWSYALEPGGKIKGSTGSVNYEVYFGDTPVIAFKGTKSYEIPANSDGSTYGYWIAVEAVKVTSTKETYRFEWHEHDKMTSDESGHFVECYCTTAKVKFTASGPHTAGETVFVPDAGVCGDNASGENVTYCGQVGCGYVMSREAATGKIDHVEGVPVQENLIPATCDVNGSVDTVVYCANGCGYEFSRTTSVLPMSGHNVDRIGLDDVKQIVDTQPTCEERGWWRYYYYCKNPGCDYLEDAKYSGVIDPLGHEPGTPVRENEVAATCTAEGSYDEVVYCTRTDCGMEISRTPKTEAVLGHEPGDKTIENNVDATCTVPGSYDEVIYCTRTDCGVEISRQSITGKTLPHDVDADENKWASDSEKHWHACSDCSEKFDAQAHTLVWETKREATEKEAGLKVCVCSVCGYVVEEEIIPALIPAGSIDNLPKTGDESNFLLWIALAGFGIFGACMLMRKRSEA